MFRHASVPAAVPLDSSLVERGYRLPGHGLPVVGDGLGAGHHHVGFADTACLQRERRRRYRLQVQEATGAWF